MIINRYGGLIQRISVRKVFGISLIAIILLVSSAGAAPYAYVANSGSNNVSVIDMATNTVTTSVNVEMGPRGIAVNPAGTKLYVTNSGSNSISVIDTINNTVTGVMGVGGYGEGVVVNPAGTKVYVTTLGGFYVIDTANNTVTTGVNNIGGYYFRGVAVSPDGTRVYVASEDNNTVSVIDTITKNIIATVHIPIPYGVAVNPAGTKVYVTTRQSGVFVIDTATNSVIATVNGTEWSSFSRGIAVSPDGTRAYVTNYAGDNVSVIDTSINSVISSINVGSYPLGVAITPDGKRVYVANNGNHIPNGTVSVIDTASNTVITTVDVGSLPIGIAITQTPTPESTFNISGYKINGTDNNGTGIANWNIMLMNGTGEQIASTVTDSTGFYNFTGLTNGTYNVTEGMMMGWTNTSTSPISQIVTIHGGDATNLNFTNVLISPEPVATFNISGFKINNTIGSGIQGWNITLMNSTMQKSMLTGADGSYKFTSLVNGTYNVTEETKTGWTNVSPISQQVTINGADMTNINFTNQPPTSTPTPTPTPTPITSSITVNSPNGGENWQVGSTHTIKWSYTGNPGANIKIELLKSGKVNWIITSRYSIGKTGTGTYNWKIPFTQVLGTDYKIRITSVTNSAYTDTSDGDFSISAPTSTPPIPLPPPAPTPTPTEAKYWVKCTEPTKCISDIFAGYAVTGTETKAQEYLDVKGEWEVSEISCPVAQIIGWEIRRGYGGVLPIITPIFNTPQVAVWVGLGGFYSEKGGKKSIAQIGVYSGCEAKGTALYYPVYQMIQKNDKGEQISKHGATEITEAFSDIDNKPVIPVVKPKDKIFAEVHYDQKGKYILTIRDITQKWHTDLPPQTFIGKDKDSPAYRHSAEWIVEAPPPYRLAQFNPITFINAKVNDYPITTTSGQIIKEYKMIISESDPTPKAIVEPPLDSTGTSFGVKWKHE